MSEPDSTAGLITAVLNQTLSLRCQHGTAGEPGAELVWLRNGDLVNLKENNKRGNSSICVTPVTKADNGAVFTCQLKDNTTCEASVTLNVTCKLSEKTLNE